MAARLVTDADVRRGTGGPIRLDGDTAVTPAALDRAFLRGVEVVCAAGPTGRMKGLVTAADVDRVPRGGELVVAPGTIVTPAARDRAELRRVRFVPPAATDARAPAAASPSAAGGPQTPVQAPGFDENPESACGCPIPPSAASAAPASPAVHPLTAALRRATSRSARAASRFDVFRRSPQPVSASRY